MLEMRGKLVLLLALLLSLLLITFIVSVIIEWKPTESSYDPDLFGMHEAIASRHLSDEKLNISRVFEVLQSLGVRKIRESIWRWYMLNSTTFDNETIKNAVKYVIRNASLFGIEIMAYVQDFPSWMTDVVGDPQTIPHRNMTEGSKYKRFLEVYEESWKTLSREFPEIEVWEIGNEYNLPQFLHPQSGTFSLQERVDIVTDLLYWGSRGIRTGNPNATTVMCGLGPIQNSTHGNGIYDIRDFLNLIYENIESDRWSSTDSDDFFQVACWHPYTFTVKPTKLNWVNPNKAVYEVVKNHGDENKRVVFSEMGFSDNCTGLSEEEVADYLLETFGLTKDNFLWLDTIYWFRLIDRDPKYDPDFDCSEYGYGVVETPRENWLWKPAAYAYESLAHSQRIDQSAEWLTMVVTVESNGHQDNTYKDYPISVRAR